MTCLWLNPIHPTPQRDDGYDVSDYYGVDPRLGTLGDFVELATQARERGIRILLDLVVNHTSDQHPWFRSARAATRTRRTATGTSGARPSRPTAGRASSSPASRPRPGPATTRPSAWYFHRFYDFQPDLNWSNPAVRAEIKKVMAFWLQLGASGFRIDAAPFVLEQVAPGVDPAPKDFSILDDWRQDVQWRNGDAVLLCEANVDADDLPAVLRAPPPDGPNDRAHMLFAFGLNAAAVAGAGPARRRAARSRRSARCPRCRRWRSGRPSCATTTSSTSAG